MRRWGLRFRIRAESHGVIRRHRPRGLTTNEGQGEGQSMCVNRLRGAFQFRSVAQHPRREPGGLEAGRGGGGSPQILLLSLGSWRRQLTCHHLQRSTKAALLGHRLCFFMGGGSWHQHILRAIIFSAGANTLPSRSALQLYRGGASGTVLAGQGGAGVKIFFGFGGIFEFPLYFWAF